MIYFVYINKIYSIYLMHIYYGFNNEKRSFPLYFGQNIKNAFFPWLILSTSPIVFSMPEIPFSISCILLVIIVFSLMLLFSFSDLGQFYLFSSSFYCIFPYFFKGFNFLFKGLYHLHKIGIKVIFLCFRAVLEYSGLAVLRIAGLWWCHIALDIVNCVFILASSHLRLGLL